MEYNKYEIIAKERGYTITPEGVVFSPKGKQVGTYGKNKYMYFSIGIRHTSNLEILYMKMEIY